MDLGKKSNLEEFGSNYKNFYGADYDRRKTVSFHREGHHVYSVSKTALESDVIINLPKLKTHMKAGVTISLKNMIGIIGEKAQYLTIELALHQEVGMNIQSRFQYSKHSHSNSIVYILIIS